MLNNVLMSYHLFSDKDDLVTFGLRNLDMWVNTLRTESLEPILRPVMPELLVALFSHLRPIPHQFGMLSMKILAKLGGMNRFAFYLCSCSHHCRKYLTQPSIPDDRDKADAGLKIQINFIHRVKKTDSDDIMEQVTFYNQYWCDIFKRIMRT